MQLLSVLHRQKGSPKGFGVGEKGIAVFPGSEGSAGEIYRSDI